MPTLAPDAPTWLVALWVGTVGAVVGSFLNVVVARVPAGESIVSPGSRCPACRQAIRWYDNVPVLSWLLLRARCRRCGAPISARYPLVELLGAAAALAAFWQRGLGLAALAQFAFSALLLALAAIDLDTWLLPNALTWPLAVLGLAAAAAGLAPAPSFPSALSGAAVGLAALAAVAVIGKRIAGKEAMGWGDVWLLCGLGAWLGLGALLPIVLLASIQGTIVGLALIPLGKAQTGERRGSPPAPPVAPKPAAPAAGAGPRQATAGGEGDGGEDWVPPRNAVPFGPFLALGALEWLYLGGLIARAVPVLEVFR